METTKLHYEVTCLTVEQWLGENNKIGIDIWNKKYRNGNETFDEWLDRVSNNSAALKEMIVKKQFLFGGRILSNRGLNKTGKKVTYSNCFLPGTEVSTSKGYKTIETIKEGELVQTEDGSFHPVNAVMSRDYDGEIFYLQGNKPIGCTPNHKFLTDKGWKTIEEIYQNKQDSHPKKYKIFSPDNFQFLKLNKEVIDLSNFLEFNDSKREIIVDEEKIYLRTSFIGGNGAKGQKTGNPIQRFISINEDIAYLFGRYLGDGSITYVKDVPSIFQIVFNEKTEKDAYLKCKEIIEQNFGITTTSNHNPNQGTLVLKVNNILFGLFILKMCGRTENKHFPEKLKNSLSVLLGLLDSDGCVTTSGAIQLVLKSESLMFETYKALINNGINVDIPKKIIQSDKKHLAFRMYIPSYSAIKLLPMLLKKYLDDRMTVKENPSQYEKRDNGNFIYIKKPIKGTYSGKVYNLSVEVNHSYVVQGFVAHNCYVITPPEDNIESIFDCAKALARTFSYGGGCGIDISKLAPAGARVNNTAEETSGAVSFMDLYSTVTALIGQKGRRK